MALCQNAKLGSAAVCAKHQPQQVEKLRGARQIPHARPAKVLRLVSDAAALQGGPAYYFSAFDLRRRSAECARW